MMASDFTAGARPTARGFDFLKDVSVRLSVELGRTEMTLRDVCALGEDSVVVLDRLTDELLDVMVNGKLIARGEVVPQGNRFGLRIVELTGSDDAPTAEPAPDTAPGGLDLTSLGLGPEFA